MKWNVAQAKQHLPEVLRAAELEPQRLLNRQRFCAEEVDGPTSDELVSCRRQQAKPSLSERFAELRQICAEEAWEMPEIERRDRPNPWADDGISVSSKIANSASSIHSRKCPSKSPSGA